MKDSEVLTPDEQAGREEILEGVKNKDWIVYNSDKSGRIVLDTKTNYLRCMKEHYISDPVSNAEEVRKAEKVLNNHVRAWSGVFNIGEGIGQKRRCARALISNYVTIPVLQGLRKDHKPNIDGDPSIGPKMRPLCAANKAPNANLGNLVAKVSKAVGDTIADSGGEVISGEEMKRKIEDVNKARRVKTFKERPYRNAPPIQKPGELKVYSMDVSALYPSIQKDMASKAILEAVKLSNLEWKNLDITKLVQYVALTVD